MQRKRIGRVAPIGALLVAMCGSAWAQKASAQSAGFKTVTSRVGSFSLSMPGTPKREVLGDERRTSEGPVVGYVSESNGVGYLMNYGKVEFQDAKDTPRALLGRSLAGMLDGPKAKQLSRRDFVQQGMTGVDATQRDAQGVVSRVRLMLKGKRMYMLIVSPQKSDAASRAKADRFLRSLRVTGGK